MKILFLNAWFGTKADALYDFILEHEPTTDIFCFSEISNDTLAEKTDGSSETGVPNLFTELSKRLGNFEGRFDQSGELRCGGIKKNPIGLALFVRKSINADMWGSVVVNENAFDDDPEGFERIMQHVRVKIGDRYAWVNNMHGLALPGSKLDTPNRIKQSESILAEMEKQEGERILGGDFNLELNTESVHMFEKNGYRNLIREYNIGTTRSDLNRAKYAKEDWQYYADYVFVSSDVKVTKFEVPNVNVSDHLPLVVEIE